MLQSALEELKASKLAAAESFFRSVEASLTTFFATAQALAERTMAEFGSAGSKHGHDAYDDELYALLADREALGAAITASQEARLAKLAELEAQLRDREDQRCAGAVASLRADELARNRSRIAEITALFEACCERVENALGPPSGDVGLRGETTTSRITATGNI